MSTYALTTTFKPAASCFPGSFDMLNYHKYFIYNNYPDPIPKVTRTDCYPTEFLNSYKAQKTQSSVLPPIAPLICPSGWAEVKVDYVDTVPNGYLACCPSGWSLAAPPKPFVSDRPAFNATCVSNIKTITVTPYSTDSALASSIWTGSAGDQAYGVIMEGYATPMTVTPGPNEFGASSTTMSRLTIPLATSTSVLPSSSSAGSSEPSSGGGYSQGAVAGIVLGSIGFAAIVGVTAVYLVRRWVMHHQAHQRLDEFNPPRPEAAWI